MNGIVQLSKDQIDLLLEMVNNNYVRKYDHPTLPISLYKYTQNCVFEGMWNDITLMCRGLVLDDNYNVVANCIPKFFNYEELQQERVPKVNLNQPFTVTRKEDGSLIQAFMYNDELVITSSGGFDNDYTKKAEELLNKSIVRYFNTYNFIFELICPLSRVVINYNDNEELKLIAIRDRYGVEHDYLINKVVGAVQKEHFNSIEDLVKEKQSAFKNIEGYVLKFEDGSRVKFKYDEYFTLHKTVAHVSKMFVWEAMSKGIPLPLDNIPDETFSQIKTWQSEILGKYNLMKIYLEDPINQVKYFMENNASRKDIAEYIISKYKDISGILFRVVDSKDYNDLIWKLIKPTGD